MQALHLHEIRMNHRREHDSAAVVVDEAEDKVSGGEETSVTGSKMLQITVGKGQWHNLC